MPTLLALYAILFAHILARQTSEGTAERHEEIQAQHAAISRQNEVAGRKAEEQDERIASLLNEFAERLDQRLVEVDDGTFYMARRPVPLNENKRFHGPAILWLFPGQEVELIERSGKWIRVIAYDTVSGRTHIGWVLKKYLRRIE